MNRARHRTSAAGLITIALLMACGGEESATQSGGMRTISMAALQDKVRGGWAGQMIGVALGAPTEFQFNGRMVEGQLKWHPKMVQGSLYQDDLYVEMTFAEVMDRIGLDATTEQYGEAFKNSKYRLWHANAGARRALNQGIKAPMSGHPTNNIHANDIDFQIEADFIGLMTPGMPGEAIKYCNRVGRVMNYGDGLYGGMFVCGMYSAAYFESDPKKVVEAGLACLPPQSGYAKVIQDVLEASAAHPDDWTETWRTINAEWDKDDDCVTGALTPFNIDARLNGAYIAIGLIYGRGDFGRTLDISTRCGQDSDCNPSSAAGILGVMIGYDAIPEVWKSEIPAIADLKFDFTSYSFNEIVASTIARARKIAEGAGGGVSGGEMRIPNRKPIPPELEQWDMGAAQEIVWANMPAWTWTGAWGPETQEGRVIGISNRPGRAEATLKFSGTGIAIVGPYRTDGGRADVYLDGEKAGTINAYADAKTNDTDLWHKDGLAGGDHVLKIVMREDADERSAGSRIVFQAGITYKK